MCSTTTRTKQNPKKLIDVLRFVSKEATINLYKISVSYTNNTQVIREIIRINLINRKAMRKREYNLINGLGNDILRLDFTSFFK